jgi:flagellar operon protein
MLQRIDLAERPVALDRQRTTAAPSSGPSEFAGLLAEKMRPGLGVTFSAHAAQRLADRRLPLTETDRTHISRAIDKASAKGAREALLIMDRMALIVSVPNRTVITVVPQHELDDTVFTNIDSAVVVAQRAPLPSLV